MELRKQTILSIFLVSSGLSLAIFLATFIVNMFPEKNIAIVATATAPLIDFSVLEHGANLAELERGRVYYAQLCSSCHGAYGNGYGEWAYRVKPRPSDLTSIRVQQHSDQYLFSIISEGQARSPMVGWKNQLSERQRWQVVGYLRHLALQKEDTMRVES